MTVTREQALAAIHAIDGGSVYVDLPNNGGVDVRKTIRTVLQERLDGKCMNGENCDLTIAYMKGVADGKDSYKPKPATDALAAEIKNMEKFIKEDYLPESGYLPNEFNASQETTKHWMDRIKRAALQRNDVPQGYMHPEFAKDLLLNSSVIINPEKITDGIQIEMSFERFDALRKFLQQCAAPKAGE